MISEVLKNNSVLTKLDLNGKLKGKRLNRKRKGKQKMEWTGNEIGAEGTKAISELLESNSVLSELNLGSEKEI